MKEQKEEYGLFQLRPETFQAKRVKQYEEHIDENGEMLIGLKGNWKIIDSHGSVFYYDKHVFNNRMAPLDRVAFEMILEEREEIIEKTKEAKEGK